MNRGIANWIQLWLVPMSQIPQRKSAQTARVLSLKAVQAATDSKKSADGFAPSVAALFRKNVYF